MQSIGVENQLKEMTNLELAKVLDETILNELPILSPQYDLISEIVNRLKDGDDYEEEKEKI